MEQSVNHDHELQAHALFAGLSAEQMTEVRSGIQVVRLPEGGQLFSQGQTAERFYLVRSGQMKLYRLSATGNEKIIDIIHPGQSFAEALMFMDAPRYPVNAQALAATELFAISNRQFMGVLRNSVDTCFRVMADMSLRLHQLLNEIDALTLQNATLRLVQFLLAQVPHGAEDDATFNLPAAKNIIASRLSIQPETLSRILHNLSDNGLITVKGLQVQIHDLKGLHSYY